MASRILPRASANSPRCTASRAPRCTNSSMSDLPNVSVFGAAFGMDSARTKTYGKAVVLFVLCTPSAQ